MTRRTAGWLLRLGLSAGILVAMATLMPFGEALAAVLQADPRLVLLAFALLVPTLVTAALRMRALVQVQGLSLRLHDLIAINLATSFYALFLPGLLAAGAIRWYRLARTDGRPAAALAVIGFSRLIEIEVTIAMGLAFWASDPQTRLQHAGLAAGFACALAAAVLCHLLGPRLAAALPASPVRPGWLGALRQAAAAAGAAIARFRTLGLRAQLATLGYSVLTQLLGVAALVLLARALAIEISPAALGWSRSLLLILLLLPVSWAGVGLREAGLAVILAPFGVPASQAVALGLLLSARGVVEGLCGGLVEAGGLAGRRRAAAP